MPHRTVVGGVFLLGLASPARAQEAEPATAASIDAAISSVMAPVAEFVAGVVFYSVPFAGTELPLIVAWLAVAAVFFPVYFGFINVRAFGHAIELIRGDWTSPRCP